MADGNADDKRRLAGEFADLRRRCYRVAKDAAYAARMAAYQADGGRNPMIDDVSLARLASDLKGRIGQLGNDAVVVEHYAKLLKAGLPLPLEDE